MIYSCLCTGQGFQISLGFDIGYIRVFRLDARAHIVGILICSICVWQALEPQVIGIFSFFIQPYEFR